MKTGGAYWMRVSEELKYNAEMAGLYGLLAQYYEYRDPQTHYYYYTKHLQFAVKAAELARREDPPPEAAARAYPAETDDPEARAWSPHTDYAVHEAVDGSGSLAPEPDLQGYGMARETAKVRAIHAIPDAPAVDVYVNGQKLLKGVEYKASTSFITVPSGTYRLDVFPAGTGGPALLSETVTIAPGMGYTLAATGTAESPQLMVYQEELHAPPGSVRLRFIHLSPDAPAVDIAPKNGSVLFPNVVFRAATRYATIAPGTYNMEVRTAGTNNVVFAVPTTRLSGGHVYNVIILGLAGGSSALEAMVLRD